MSQDLEQLERRLEHLRAGMQRLRGELARSFLGQDRVLDELLWCVLAGGHALLEGAPGLGKTTLVRALARALDLSFQRIQFTPDLMPADVLGMRILEESASGARSFRFQRGPIFTHVLLADEINRATPRTQSALLEAMQETQVTVFGETLELEDPFCVVATQNPIEMEGTYPLPEAQLDRFMAKILVASPSEKELVSILQASTGRGAAPGEPCLSRTDLLELRSWTRDLPASSEICKQAARIVLATDPRRERVPAEISAQLRYGAGPRGGQALLLLGKARALSAGRLAVEASDLAAVAPCALRHRLVFHYEGEASGTAPDQLVAAAVNFAQSNQGA